MNWWGFFYIVMGELYLGNGELIELCGIGGLLKLVVMDSGGVIIFRLRSYLRWQGERLKQDSALNINYTTKLSPCHEIFF